MKNWKCPVSKHFPQGSTLGEVLQKMSSLSLDVVKDAAIKGAVSLQIKGRGKILKARDIQQRLDPSDVVFFTYDPKVLSLPTFQGAQVVDENKNYGVWIKPAGIMPQGSQSGDHTSLIRAVEVIKGKEVFLVHRLDRETEGLMILAYNSQAAGLLSDLFARTQVHKTYQAIVKGSLPVGSKQTINASLDDKKAITHIEVLKSNESLSLLKVEIETGRLHQIRRHLDHIGHPIMGDPKYGQGNKNRKGLQLLARSLSFQDPWNKKVQSWSLDKSLDLNTV